MKENAPKKIRFQTLRTLWVPLAIGVVTVAALAVVVGMVWKDYRTAMMDSQTRQMELVVQSTADSIRVLRCPHHPDGGHLLLAVPQR